MDVFPAMPPLWNEDQRTIYDMFSGGLVGLIDDPCIMLCVFLCSADFRARFPWMWGLSAGISLSYFTHPM